MESEGSPNKAVIGLIVVVLLAVVGGAVFYLTQQNNDTNQAEVTSSQDTGRDNEPNGTNEASGEYADGTYTAIGSYQSPGGQEEIELRVTLTGGEITQTNATTKAASGTSRQYQREFINNYKDLVVGKSIDSVELDRVAGSSLTSNGFNEALDEIKREAAV